MRRAATAARVRAEGMGRQMRTSSRRTRRTRRTVIAAVAAALALTAAGCGGGDDDKGTPDGGGSSSGASGSVPLPDLKGQKLEVAAVWTGPEQKNFQKVLDEFTQRTGAEVGFVPTGDNVSTFL